MFPEGRLVEVNSAFEERAEIRGRFDSMSPSGARSSAEHSEQSNATRSPYERFDEVVEREISYGTGREIESGELAVALPTADDSLAIAVAGFHG